MSKECILRAKVIALDSGYRFTDGISRFTLRFVDADSMYQDIKLKQNYETTFEIDDYVEVLLSNKGEINDKNK